MDEKEQLDAQLEGSVELLKKRSKLRDKAVDIKGKKYVLVSDRVLFFNEEYPEGSITTELVSAPADDVVIIKAIVMPTPNRMFTGYSQAKWGDGYINKTSALENAETSAVGRALAFMGIGVIESIASVDEINKAERRTSEEQKEFGEKKLAELKKKFSAQSKPVNGMEKAGEIANRVVPSTTIPGRISEGQVKHLWIVAREHKWTETEVRDLLGSHGYEHTKEITPLKYKEIITELEQGQ